MDKLTPEQGHRNMVAVKSKGTKIEDLLAKAMWQAGLRYRRNDKTVFGHPDFSHKGKYSTFYGCSNFPECDFTIRDLRTSSTIPKSKIRFSEFL